jgi:hypothetical protein
MSAARALAGARHGRRRERRAARAPLRRRGIWPRAARPHRRSDVGRRRRRHAHHAGPPSTRPTRGALPRSPHGARRSPTRAWPAAATLRCAAVRCVPLPQRSRAGRPHRRQTFGRQDVGAHQVDFSPNLPRQIGQVDARLLARPSDLAVRNSDSRRRDQKRGTGKAIAHCITGTLRPVGG